MIANMANSLTYSGLSTDKLKTSPTSYNIQNGDFYFETDTCKVYIYDVTILDWRELEA